MTRIIRLAEQNISVTTLASKDPIISAVYHSEGDIAFSVVTGQKDIDYEREKSIREAEREGHVYFPYSDDYLESLAVSRKIAEKMPDYDTFLFHGSCISVDGSAYLFTAKSGTGKSTHTRLWRQLLGDQAVMVNDDKPLIHVNENGTAVAYGTPWDGKHRLSNNIAVPLKSICILEQAADNSIRKITKQEALPMLLQQAYRPSDPAALAKTLVLIDRLDVKLYRLSCNMNISAAELSYNTMRG